MVRKRKKHEEDKPWCFYCDREFNDENDLILHQKNKHFKCVVCNKRLSTAKALTVHSLQVHKFTVQKIPDAKDGREDPKWDIFGSSGIPPGMQRGGQPPPIDTFTAPDSLPYSVPPAIPPPMRAPSVIQPAYGRPPPPGYRPPYGAPPPNPHPYYPPGLPRPVGVPPQPYRMPIVPPQGQYGAMAPPYGPRPGYPSHPPMPGYGMPPPPRGTPVAAVPLGTLQPPRPGAGMQQPPLPALPTVSSVQNTGAAELIWNEEEISMEERRASLSKYSPAPNAGRMEACVGEA